MHQSLCHVKTDSPSPDHGHPPPHRRTAQRFGIAQHIRPVLPRNSGITRQDPGCDDNRVKAAQIIRRRLVPKPQVDPGLGNHRLEPGHQPLKLFLARHPSGQVQLPAPAAATACASNTTSSQVDPSGTRSIRLIR